MLSGSLAAVAGAVFFLSERTRAAAAAAAILPSAVAAISSLRIGARIKSGSETSHFQVSSRRKMGKKRKLCRLSGSGKIWNFSRIRIRFLKDFYPDSDRTKFVFSTRCLTPRICCDSSVECGFTWNSVSDPWHFLLLIFLLISYVPGTLGR